MREHVIKRKRLGHSHGGRARISAQLHSAVSSGDLDIERLVDEQCRRHLAPFVRRAFATVNPAFVYKPNWHVDLICEYLEAVVAGDIPRLVINIPPRFLKSLIASISFPAWLLGRNPSERVICASYVDRLVLDLSVDCRTVMQSEWYRRTFPAVAFAHDQNEKAVYKTTMGGFRKAVSMGGSVTGHGGKYKILDDPLDPQGASSEAELKKASMWIDRTWSSRNADPKDTRELLIMQRLSIKDPTAHLLAKDGGWEVLKLPLEAPKSILIRFPISGREIKMEEGDLLHPDYMGPREVSLAKSDTGTYGFQAQYQQEPVPEGGGQIKMEWFPRYGALPHEFDETVLSFDTAGKGKATSNATAGLAFGRVGTQWYLLKSTKERLAYPARKRHIISMAARYEADAVLIEDKSSGESLLEDLGEETDLPLVAIMPPPGMDKMVRMETQLPLLEARRLALPDPQHIKADWLFDLETNLQAFPDPPEWDEIDALSQFLKWLRKRDKTKKAPWAKARVESVESASAWRT